MDIVDDYIPNGIAGVDKILEYKILFNVHSILGAIPVVGRPPSLFSFCIRALSLLKSPQKITLSYFKVRSSTLVSS